MSIRTNLWGIAILLLFICSCNKKEFNPIVPEQATVIEFGKVATKAVDNIDDISKFGVSIAMSNTISGTDYVSLLNDETVTKVVPESGPVQWNYDKTRYWLENSHYYFVASASDQEIQGFQEVSATVDGIKYIGYALEVETPSNADLDILTATRYVNTPSDLNTTENGWSKTVSLNFSHLLTKVNFKIKQDFTSDPDNDYYIRKVTVSNIQNKGIYELTPNNGEFAPRMYISDDSSLDAYVKEFNSPIVLRGATNDDQNNKDALKVWENGLLLIPQDVRENTIRVRIDYDYLRKGSETFKPLFIEVYIPTPKNDGEKWGSGKQLTYILKIANPTEIKFDAPVIEPWGSPQTGGTVIIK